MKVKKEVNLGSLLAVAIVLSGGPIELKQDTVVIAKFLPVTFYTSLKGGCRYYRCKLSACPNIKNADGFVNKA